jgi:hypothetical protein
MPLKDTETSIPILRFCLLLPDRRRDGVVAILSVRTSGKGTLSSINPGRDAILGGSGAGLCGAREQRKKPALEEKQALV